MKVLVDKDKCIGCGSCVSVCPEVFELSANGKAEIKTGADLEAHKDKVQEAVDVCPVQAISVE
ncbi:MAG: ferredoxin [Patescibacteria group bacterium]|jgi:ferredoxin